MDLSDRRQKIVDFVEDMDEVGIDFLSSELNVSHSTIYRDLLFLEKKGFLKKTNKGAVCVDNSIVDKDSYFFLGFKINPKEKKAIAKKALELLNNGDSIILDSGTINFMLAKEINKSSLINIIVITNNVFTQLKLLQNRNEQLRVFATGGLIENGCASTLGDFIQDIMKNVKADIAFLTTKAIALDGSISELDYGDASIKKYFIKKAKTTILLTQSQKFGKVGIYKVGNIQDFDLVITDSGINKDKAFSKILKDFNINLQIVK